MDGDITADYVISELFDMGFEFSAISKAIEAVGPSLDEAVEFILNDSCKNDLGPDTTQERACSSYNCSTSQCFPSREQIGSLHSVDLMEQTKLLQRDKPPLKVKPPIWDNVSSWSEHSASFYSSDNQELKSDWEKKVDNVLKNHFGFTSLKSFQKEALEAWLANRDCLILAATGSGKSLCFQIPALLTGKVVVVISPLISLMHDQCMKLAQHGVSACFLGSGQTDSSVEQKAMSGMYSIIYVCPETILRLVGPLQRLAQCRGIALFAIDEVHCVSKWGHDFRPDYRRLSVLRESFNACNLKSKCDIPLMALTATATVHVREDILKSLHMSKETNIVITSFFRPNLRFSVCHSRTSCISSYEKDFRELIHTYTTSRMVGKKECHTNFHNLEDESDSSSVSANADISDVDERSLSDYDDFEDDCDEGRSADMCLENESDVDAPNENQMSVEYLEDELDIPQSVDDLDVSCGEFTGISPMEAKDLSRPSEALDQVVKLDANMEALEGPLGQGPTIIYMPTRKETVRLAKYLCSSGVRAAAYHAKLPKKHLRSVHEKFHQNILEVVVATIAFGMGIDKSNVRRIIHYGWPQSLEAYYQEAGRAGRDGKLADCTLYANLSRIPTLLPSKRSEEQTKQAYKMLADCFRYGMSTSCCRAKTLVKYFGEDLTYDKCFMCDICVGGPPKLQNLKKETDIFLRVLIAHYGPTDAGEFSYTDTRCIGKQLNLHMVMDSIREQCREFAASDQLWWRGLARILEDKGYIREGDNMIRVCIRYPKPTALGLKFLQSEIESTFYAYPEADMLLPRERPTSKNSDWGRGWADPEIRRQRLQSKRRRKGKKKFSRYSHRQNLSTVRGRIISKLSKQKH